jgi:hypothetical protein
MFFLTTLSRRESADGIRDFWVLSNGGRERVNWRRCLWQTAQIMLPETE